MQFNFNNPIDNKQMYDPEYDPINHMVDVNSRRSVNIYQNSVLDFYLLAYNAGAIGQTGQKFLEINSYMYPIPTFKAVDQKLFLFFFMIFFSIINLVINCCQFNKILDEKQTKLLYY